MFDFRYHTISLIAVFLALAVGLVVGVAIGDKGLVSSAEKSLRQNLRADIDRANAQIDDLNDNLNEHNAFEAAAFPPLVDGRLVSHRVGIVFIGDSSQSLTERVQDAVRAAGGQLVTQVVLKRPPDLADVAARAGRSRYAALVADPKLLGPFAERIGTQLVAGGRLIEHERRTVFSSSQGRLDGLDGVVVVRDSDSGADGAAAANAKTFEDGFVKGMNATDVPVVGIETTATDPSQVPWFRDHDLASVDDVDQLAGQAALVFALTGIDGAFGVKDTAEGILPKIVSPGQR